MKSNSMNQIERAKNKRREKFWVGSGKFFLILIIVYLVYIATLKIIEAEKNKNNIFNKKDIEIEGNHIISQEMILNICGFEHSSDKKIPIDIDRVAQKIMSLNYVQGVSITARPPRKLNITVEERKPIAFIYGRGLNLIDNQGYLMPVPEINMVWDLPLISGIKQKLGKLGEMSVAADTYLALEIVTYLELENPLLLALISEINLNKSNYIELFLTKGGATIRISRNSFYKELYILKNYLANYIDWAQLHMIEYIDLRFKDQLVVKSKV